MQSTMQPTSQLDQIKAVYEDGFAEINGRKYEFSATNHSRRVAVFSYFTSIQPYLEKGSFSFLDSNEFKKVWKSIEDIMLYDGVQLSKQPQHWDDYPEDYILLIVSTLSTISYPFLRSVSRTD